MNLIGVLEGILFVVGDEGVTLEEISRILEIPKEEVKQVLLQLKEKYDSDDRGLRIRYLGDAFKLTTKEEHKVYFQKFLMNADTHTLSPAALEVLAIVAYNEPITRVEIDEMRGISSSFTIRKLIAKGLLKEAGKSDMPGRPNLYKTTKEFLDYFGLATKEDLPKLEDFMPQVEEDKEPELFTSIYKEEEHE